MNSNILKTEVQEFIKNCTLEITELALKGSPFIEVPTKDLIIQIESRRKAEKKLPTWFQTDKIVYPPKLNIEQTSSEIASNYKASIVEGRTILDMTGGFGVDSYYFSQKFEKVFHYEINKELSEIAAANLKTLFADNVDCFNEDGLNALNNSKFNIIYADPSRRHETKGKVFFLRDCEPNIPENLSKILESCNVLMVKTSPMLDISVGLQELKNVFEIHIVAISNEVKELLWLLKKNYEGSPEIKTININFNAEETFNFERDTYSEAVYALPNRFLYEPNAAIMKSGAFENISEAFKIKKLHKHTHLYTSEALREFPGRRFFIEKSINYTKSEIKKNLNINTANITTRNFPESVELLRKKWKIKDGGNTYLFFITDFEENKKILVCSKI